MRETSDREKCVDFDLFIDRATKQKYDDLLRLKEIDKA